VASVLWAEQCAVVARALQNLHSPNSEQSDKSRTRWRKPAGFLMPAAKSAGDF
jgi:hypothetical protein